MVGKRGKGKKRPIMPFDFCFFPSAVFLALVLNIVSRSARVSFCGAFFLGNFTPGSDIACAGQGRGNVAGTFGCLFSFLFHLFIQFFSLFRQKNHLLHSFLPSRRSVSGTKKKLVEPSVFLGSESSTFFHPIFYADQFQS